MLGTIFGPHDFFLFLIGMIALVVFALLFTVVYGRVFCGWVCPQTIFMEMVFRKIEYWIEGDASKQMQLNRSEWNSKKILKKTSKHIIFFTLSFIIANVFLAWIIGTDELGKIITDSPMKHLGGLTSIIVFTSAFYGVFAWFREQACILVCPYGRLQGVLLDQNSIVITYDYKRGEPRGRIRKAENQNGKGDCVDCRQCVEVCPTGIDIRNGTQLECINCTACIDACDYVMEKTGRPKGLIRYASSKGISEGRRFTMTPKVIGYTTILIILIAALSYMLATRTEYEISILRTPGLLSQVQPGGKISNLYDIKINNKTFEAAPLSLRLRDMPGEIKIIGNQLTAIPQDITESKLLILLDEGSLKGLSTPIVIDIFSGSRKLDEIKTTFLGRLE